MIEFLSNFEALRITWWVLLGVLLMGFAVTDGFDLGVGALLPFVGKTDLERRVAINTVGPVWEGNQVWLILGGGAIFAAWPDLYALSFSGFYLAMFLVLLSLILRPVGFKYRSKKPDPAWRSRWDWALFVGGAVPALIFGVAVGNALRGVPFHFDEDLRPIYEGNLFGLLNPAALYCGAVSLVMLLTHGAAWLAFKADGEVARRARAIGSVTAPLTAVLFAGGGVLLKLGLLGGYRVTSAITWEGPSNPLRKTVVADPGAWLHNFTAHPILWLAPLLGVAMPFITMLGFRSGKAIVTFIASKLSVMAIIGTAGLAMFPMILSSSSHPSQGLAVFDASSSLSTLRTMLFATVVFLPLVLGYTAWVYRVLRGKVTEADIAEAGASVY